MCPKIASLESELESKRAESQRASSLERLESELAQARQAQAEATEQRGKLDADVREAEERLANRDKEVANYQVRVDIILHILSPTFMSRPFRGQWMGYWCRPGSDPPGGSGWIISVG